MLLQLRYVYNSFYKNGYDGGRFFFTKWETNRYGRPEKESTKETLEERVFEYFTHPSTFRWALPALQGKVDFCIDDEEINKILFCRQENLSTVNNQKDFLKLHFQPVYDEIKDFLESDDPDRNNNSLKDLMGRDADKFHGSGRAIRTKLLNICKNTQMIHQMVITQQTILSQYEYKACNFRSCIIGLVDRAMIQNSEEADSSLIENGILSQLRKVLLNLLSRGNDASALACLLLCAALREDAALVLFQFMENNYDIFSLAEHTESSRTELGNGLYLTFNKMSNYIGGFRKTDITLWQYPNTMVDKITDIFGYFFYPVQITDAEGFRYDYHSHGPEIKFLSKIDPFEDELALFEWMYQPDGRYFADDFWFGEEDCKEILMYAYMDKKGRFVTPFSVNVPVLDKSEGLK